MDPDAPDTAQALSVALDQAGGILPQLAELAERRGPVRLTDGAHHEVAAIIDIHALRRLEQAVLDDAVGEAAARRDTTVYVPHAEAMAQLGLDEHGHRLQAA